MLVSISRNFAEHKLVKIIIIIIARIECFNLLCCGEIIIHSKFVLRSARLCNKILVSCSFPLELKSL